MRASSSPSSHKIVTEGISINGHRLILPTKRIHAACHVSISDPSQIGTCQRLSTPSRVYETTPLHLRRPHRLHKQVTASSQLCVATASTLRCRPQPMHHVGVQCITKQDSVHVDHGTEAIHAPLRSSPVRRLYSKAT